MLAAATFTFGERIDREIEAANRQCIELSGLPLLRVVIQDGEWAGEWVRLSEGEAWERTGEE